MYLTPCLTQPACGRNHWKIYRMAEGEPHSSWAISLAEVKRGVFQRDVPGVVKAVTHVISSSDPWRANMLYAGYTIRDWLCYRMYQSGEEGVRFNYINYVWYCTSMIFYDT